MTKRRVVVTGLGTMNPLGITVDETWRNVIAGKSGVGRLRGFNPDDPMYRAGPNFPRIAGEVKSDVVLELISRGVDRKVINRTDRFTHLALGAAIEAIKDSALNLEKENRQRIGVQIGAGLGGAKTWEEECKVLFEKGVEKVSAYFIPKLIVNMATGMVSIMLGLQGPNLCTTTACAAGSHSIGISFKLIKDGDADVMVCGGTEAAITPLAFAGFYKMRAMATKWNNEPEKACRPFDRDRNGLVLAEGAGVMVLEELERALRRGAKIYAEIIGFGLSGDAHDQVEPDSLGQEICMRVALEDAGITPEEVGYINAHGTATLLGDVVETKAIKAVFGEMAYKIPISSTKSMTGHLLGAAGGVEAILTILALKYGILPPTINLKNPDPQCDLDYIPGEARKTKVRVGLSNNFGFAGPNGSLIFSLFDERATS